MCGDLPEGAVVVHAAPMSALLSMIGRKPSDILLRPLWILAKFAPKEPQVTRWPRGLEKRDVMFSIMKRLILSVKFGTIWVRALDKAAHGRDADSLKDIETIYLLLNANGPSDKVPYYVNLLHANMASKVGKFESAASSIKIAFFQIRDSKKLKNCEIHYLKYFSLSLMARIIVNLQDQDLGKILYGNRVNLAEIDRKCVRKHISSRFPIKGWS